jgi:ribonucleotide monophosphatase NagD (HAD superfamily)
LTIFLLFFKGVLWLYTNVINSSNKVINRLLEMNKKVFFITNNSTKTREELAEKAKTMEFNVGIVSTFRVPL